MRPRAAILFAFLLLSSACFFKTSEKAKDCTGAVTARPAVAAKPTRIPCVLAEVQFDEIIETPEPAAPSREVEELGGGVRVSYLRQPVYADRGDEDSVFRALWNGSVIATAEALPALLDRVKELCQ